MFIGDLRRGGLCAPSFFDAAAQRMNTLAATPRQGFRWPLLVANQQQSSQTHQNHSQPYRNGRWCRHPGGILYFTSRMICWSCHH
jgi:hypothetical protein